MILLSINSAFRDNTRTSSGAPPRIETFPIDIDNQNAGHFPPRSLPNGTVLVSERLTAGDSDVAAKLSGDSEPPSAHLPQDFRGTLTVENGTPHDSVVKIVDERAGRSVCMMYVTTGRTATAEHLRDGNFRVLFALGTDWDSAARRFTRDKSFGKFDRLLEFTTTEVPRSDAIYTEYSAFNLTLHRVVNGNASTTEIRESEFLKY